MTRSAYATTSPLTVACPTCDVWPGNECVSMSTDNRERGKPLKRCHPARCKAADDKRTLEVYPSLLAGGRMYDPQAEYNMPFPDLDPPSYLPMREPLPPRVPDLNPDTQWTTDELAAHDAEKAIDEANWLAQSDAELAAGIVPVDDGPDISFDRPAPTHDPETCRDPACECWPF